MSDNGPADSAPLGGVRLIACLLWVALLQGCTTLPREPAPAKIISAAEPAGFPQTIRMVTTDLSTFERHSPQFFRRVCGAAQGGTVNILALSGGASDGAFGAGALVGLSRAGTRPRFDLVTGVSVGALIAPFAFLGPKWDPQLEEAFSTGQSGLLSGWWGWRTLSLMLFPLGLGHSALYRLVDHYVTPQMIQAVARRSASGRQLIIATTDLDKKETVLWNMSAIAERGGEAARRLFRNVLIASASMPGVLPPVLIQVRDRGRRYQELDIDGGVTTSVFALPLVAGIQSEAIPCLRGARLYLIVNGRLAERPKATSVNTLAILRASIDATLDYNERESILTTVGFARSLGMRFRLTQIPVSYPIKGELDFRRRTMRRMFHYGESCAERGRLWMTLEQANRDNTHPAATRSTSWGCPDTAPRAAPAVEAGGAAHGRPR